MSFICDSGCHGESEISTFPLFNQLLEKQHVIILKGKNIKVENIVNEVKPLKQHIVIGHDVWIGANATILPGVTIENEVAILAGTIVSENIPDYAITGGVPGKIVKFKHSEVIIA